MMLQAQQRADRLMKEKEEQEKKAKARREALLAKTVKRRANKLKWVDQTTGGKLNVVTNYTPYEEEWDIKHKPSKWSDLLKEEHEAEAAKVKEAEQALADIGEACCDPRPPPSPPDGHAHPVPLLFPRPLPSRCGRDPLVWSRLGSGTPQSHSSSPRR